MYKEINDTDGVTWVSGQIRIPSSGFYKVRFNGSLHVYDLYRWRATEPSSGIQQMGDRTQNSNNDLFHNTYELRLCRDRGDADFGLDSPKLNRCYYYDNQPQNDTFDADNIPKYFPPIDAENGDLNFVDLAQDNYHVLGFAFGKENDYPSSDAKQYLNPLDTSNIMATVLAAKPALSWDTSQDADDPTKLAIKSPGYMKYGTIGDFDSEDDNPDIDIDYSAGPFVDGQVLDGQGNPEEPGEGNLETRTAGYYINLTTGFLSALDGWEVSDYIDVRKWNGLQFSAIVSDNPDAAIVAMYDADRQYIGDLINGPDVGDTDTYANQPINPVPLCAFVRVSGVTDTPTSISGTDVSGDNVILHRFGIQRYYTYTLTADGYTGNAYVHNGTDTAPLLIVAFIDGVAQFDTTFSNLSGALDLKLTMYFKTPDFDVSGTLIISRTIQNGSENVIGWEQTNKYKIDLDNAPANYARRGQYADAGGMDGIHYAQGEANAVVWFNAGELITVASVSSKGRYRENGMHSTYGVVAHEVEFSLSIQPFRINADWLKVNLAGNGTGRMDWNDPVNFDVDSINLVGFLSADDKTDDFIDNFCKAFNLQLTQISATVFNLNVKQTKTSVSNRYVELDGAASVADRVNTPLGLPSSYKLGFTVDTDEEGYAETGDDGGGEFDTGVPEGDTVEQTSTFSYNWFKDITKVEAAANVTIPLPIISKSDVWAATMSYPDAMNKKYTGQAYRFWYYDGLLNALGATFAFNNAALSVAKVSGEMPALSILNYKNRQYTILYNYFTLLINGASHYTEVDAYLTPLQYQQLDGSMLAMFNGDLYYVAELSGYDPNGRNKTTIKLIRKI